ncbi:MAG TPA: endolytic transglycosylase MltG [Gammaproteobacteria bacterium]|nr:endolytic transglycosylase MltG [Gammaproteobacteria bacterium]
MKRLAPIAGVVVVLAVIAAGFLYWRWFVRPLPPTSQTTVVVEAGKPLGATAAALKQQGVLYQSWDLVWLARLEGKSTDVRAGEYAVPPHATTASLLDKLVSGNVILHSFTVIDGWTFHELMKRLEADPLLKHTLKGLSDGEIMARIGHPDEQPEGRFFPDTYKFPRGMSDVTFLRHAYDLMQEHLREAWAERDPDMSLDSPYKSLILASIVEKESGKLSELPRIAGVFVRRLRRGMRLQSDPTVIYGLGKSYDGDITYNDLRSDTPYNTYTRRGLPPTPISLPSLAAIHAAMHPARGDALYFVSKGDGSHAFSATLAEQRRAVRKYQLDGKGK